MNLQIHKKRKINKIKIKKNKNRVCVKNETKVRSWNRFICKKNILRIQNMTLFWKEISACKKLTIICAWVKYLNIQGVFDSETKQEYKITKKQQEIIINWFIYYFVSLHTSYIISCEFAGVKCIFFQIFPSKEYLHRSWWFVRKKK